MTWLEAFVRRWWALLAAGAVILAAAAVVPSLTGESEKCLTTHGRKLCGDEAKAWCRATAPLIALSAGFNPSAADLRELRRFAPAQAKSLERQAAEHRARIEHYDEVCGAFK